MFNCFYFTVFEGKQQMYALNLPFSMNFKENEESIGFLFASKSKKSILKEAMPTLHFLEEINTDLIDEKREEFEICNQLNCFMAFVEKRKQRVEKVESTKGWIGVAHKELQYFHMANLINYLTEHKEYCTSECYGAICKVLFSDEYMSMSRSDMLHSGFFSDGLNYSPISNNELDRIFLYYISEGQKPIVYNCAHIIDVPLATLDHIFRSENIIKKCQHCGKIFVPQRANEQYCNGLSPEYTDKTCKEAMKYKKQLERESQNPIYQEYKRTYNALYRRTLTRDLRKQEAAEIHLKAFMITSDDLKEKMSEEEYIKWLISQKKYKNK